MNRVEVGPVCAVVHSPGVLRLSSQATLLLVTLAIAACSQHASVAVRSPVSPPSPTPAKAVEEGSAQPSIGGSAPVSVPGAPIEDEHWYFESLSPDGKRALLRQLDPSSQSTFHVRVVDVDSKKTLDEIALPELAKIPASTIGGKPTELAALEWMLASPAFGRDVVKGARVAGEFPFGECGRLAAAAHGKAIAFDAGDWLYVADETGRVRKRLVDEAAYDPRFTPDGKYLFFRRATGTVDVFAKYELFVVPSDLSAPPRALPNTAGMRDRFVMSPDQREAFAIAAQPMRGRTAPDACVVSLSLKPPFPVKRLACLDDNEQLVDSVISPKGKWAALSTKRRNPAARDSRPSSFGVAGQTPRLEWRLRVVALTTGKVFRDEPDTPGLGLRAISDSGLLVQSGAIGTVIHDVPRKRRRELGDLSVELGHRGFFRSDTELVYVADANVGVIDLSID